MKNKNDGAGEATGKIARSAGSVSAAVMCSRVLGLIREQVFAGLFGAGYAYDAFVVAFRIPNLLRDLFGEGALSAAFVTVFTDYDTNRGKEATWRLAGNVLISIAMLLSVITLIGIYWAGPLVGILAPDFAAVQGKTELTVLMTKIMFPFLILVALSAVVMGILNTKGKFFIPALSSSFFNLGSIVGGTSLALLFPRLGMPAIAGMAWGTLIGGLLQFLIQIPALRNTGFRFQPRLDPRDPGLKRIALLMLPAVVGLSATQINIFFNTNFASSCAEGSVSWLNYAFRMVQLPIGVFGVAISIAAMPVLAKHAAQNDLDGLRNTFASSLIMVFSLTIPATAGLIILAEPIISMIFERGAFTAQDTSHTALALIYYSLGLFAYSAVKITVPVFYALKKTRFPVMASFLAVEANIIFICHTIDDFQYKAIALSTSCSMTLNFLFLAIILYKELAGYPLGRLARGIAKIVMAACLMAAILLPLTSVLATWLQGSLIKQVAAVFFLIALAATIYGASLHMLKLPELTVITEKVTQRLRRSRKS